MLQATENWLRSSRFRMRTRTGCANWGKRTDSLKLRLMRPASSVVRHSPNTVEKPREYSTSPVFGSTTSTRFWPRLVSSRLRAALPGQGSGSMTTRSIA